MSLIHSLLKVHTSAQQQHAILLTIFIHSYRASLLSNSDCSQHQRFLFDFWTASFSFSFSPFTRMKYDDSLLSNSPANDFKSFCSFDRAAIMNMFCPFSKAMFWILNLNLSAKRELQAPVVLQFPRRLQLRTGRHSGNPTLPPHPGIKDPRLMGVMAS